MSNNNKNLLGSASTPLPRLIARRPEASADDGGRRARTLPRLPALSPHAEKMEEMQQHTNSNNNVPSSSSAPITFVLRPRPSLPSMETTTSLQSINASSASSPVVVVARRGGGGGGGGGGAGADAENQLRREFHPPSLPNIIIAQMPRNLAAVAGRRTTNPARTTMMVVPVPTSSPTYASPNRCSSHSSSCSPSPRHRCGGDESDIVWAPLPSLQHVGDQPPSQQQQQHVGGGGGGSCCPSSSSSTMLVFHAQTPPREHSTSEALDARTAIFMAKQRTSKPMGGGGGAGQQHQLTAQSQPAPTISGFHQHLRNSLTRPTARMWDVRHSATIPTIGELIASHPLNAVAQQYAHLHDLQMLFNDMIHELAQARPACGDVRGWIRRWLEQQKTPSSTSSSTDVVEDVAGVSITAVVQAGAAATHHHHVPLTMPMEEASSSPLHSSPSPPDSARSDAEDLRVVYRSVLRQHGDWLREQSRQAPSPPRSNTSTNNSSSINVMSVPPTTSSLSVVVARRPPPPPYTPTRVESGGGGRPHLQPATNAAAANHTHHDGSGGSSPVLTNNFGRTDESGSTSANKAKLFSPPAHHHHTPHSGSSGTG